MEWLLDLGALEVSVEDVADRVFIWMLGRLFVLVVHPERCFGVVTERMVVQPGGEVGCAADDQRTALSCLAVKVERVAVVAFRDVLELQVADFCDARAGLPEHRDKRFVPRVVTHVEEFLDVLRGEQILAFELLFVARTYVCRNPSDNRGWVLCRELVGLDDPNHKVLQNALVGAERLGAIGRLRCHQAPDEPLDVLPGDLVEVFVEHASVQEQASLYAY